MVLALTLALALLLAPGAFAVEFEGEAEPSPGDCVLWYRRPAASRAEALPIGNGRIGALVYGGVDEERIEISESTLWSAPPPRPSADSLRKGMDEIQRLLAAGQAAEAGAAAGKLEGAAAVGRPLPPIATLRIKAKGWGKASNYRRSLNLRSALAASEFEIGGAAIERDALVSAEADALLIRWSSTTGRRFDAEIFLENAEGKPAESVGWTQLRVEGEAGVDPVEKKPRRHATLVLAAAAGGGQLDNRGSAIKITNTQAFVLVVAVEAGFDNRARIEADKRILPLSMLAFDALGYGNILARRKLFDRVDARLGPSLPLPTDERARAAGDVGADSALDALLFQSARYLMISASHPSFPSMASHGVWPREDPAALPPYDLRGGLQLSYELAGPAGLVECLKPVDDLLGRLAASGKGISSGDAGAWAAFGVADRWGGTAPGGAAGLWPFGGAWLARLSFDRAAFEGTPRVTSDPLPTPLDGALAFLDAAPASGFQGVEPAWLEAPAPAPLQKQSSFVNAIKADLGRFLRERMGSDWEKIKEKDAYPKPTWLAAPRPDDWIDKKTGGLAASPEELESAGGAPIGSLYALYPGRAITRRETPELAKAAAISLEARDAAADRATPLGRAWLVGMWARLGEGERAHAALRRFMARDLGPNLAFAGSDGRIDATLLAAAGMAEMLIQSHAGEIELLPALPKAWPEGRVSGLGARGGFSAMIEWKDGKILRAMIHAGAGNRARVRAPGLARVARDGKPVVAASPEPGVLEFDTESGTVYMIDR